MKDKCYFQYIRKIVRSSSRIISMKTFSVKIGNNRNIPEKIKSKSIVHVYSIINTYVIQFYE